MNFTSNDIKIIVSMSLAIVIMSFTFPVMGLTGDTVSASEIPEFNTSVQPFADIEQPRASPGAPSRGTLNHSSNEFDRFDGSIQFELGENLDGNRTVIIANPEDEVAITDIEKVTDNEFDNHTFTANGEEVTLEGGGFVIDVISRDFSDHGEYDFVVDERPVDQAWYQGIPIVGGIVSVQNQLAAIVAWIGAILFYVFIQIGNTAISAGVIIVRFSGFLIGVFHFLLSNYAAVIGGAPTAWASVLLAIPGMLLSLQFVKMVMIIIGLFPTT